MKLTVEISDPLLREALKLAKHEGMTLRALVERGLSCVVSETEKPVSFKLRRAAFRGTGLQAEFRDGKWEKLGGAIYERQGG